MFDAEKIWQAVIAVMLAIAGGAARLLTLEDKSRIKWSLIISELFISGFAGLMIFMLARASGISGDMVGVLAGISGWIGPRVLDVVVKIAAKAAGVDVNSKKDE